MALGFGIRLPQRRASEPGEQAPPDEYAPSLDFSDERNSQYIGQVV